MLNSRLTAKNTQYPTKTGWPNLESLHGGSMMQNPDMLNNKHKPNLAVESSCNWFLVGHLFQCQLLHQQPAAGQSPRS